jgi:hypothetical protein
MWHTISYSKRGIVIEKTSISFQCVTASMFNTFVNVMLKAI